MLYDLDFLNIGEPWPPESETPRLEKYRANQLLFESRADEVYGRWVSLLSDTAGNVLEQTHYVLSFHRRLSFLWADLVAGDAPVYSATEDAGSEFVRALADKNRFGIALQEGTIDQSRYGDAIFRLSRREDGASLIRPVSPAYWYPVIEASDVRTVKYHVLARLFDNGDEKLLKVEIHGEGMVEHRLYRVQEQRIKERVGNPKAYFPAWEDFEELPPGVDGPLVVHAPGQRTSERLHGLDDYTAIDSKMEYLMWLMAQRQGVIHKHLAPSMAGPPGQLATLEDGTEVYVSGSKYFEISDPSEGFIPQYITWDGKLEASFTQSEKIWRDVYLTSETSEAAFGHSETGYAESGTALRLRMLAPLKKAARMQERLDDPVKRILTLACALEGRSGLDPKVEWKDGLPKDLGEETEREATAVAAKLTSQRSAMKRLYDYTDQQVDEELERIAEESKGQESDPMRALTSQFLTGGGGLTNGARQEEGREQDTRIR